jgi:hypothetical protein
VGKILFCPALVNINELKVLFILNFRLSLLLPKMSNKTMDIFNQRIILMVKACS